MNIHYTITVRYSLPSGNKDLIQAGSCHWRYTERHQAHCHRADVSASQHCHLH